MGLIFALVHSSDSFPLLNDSLKLLANIGSFHILHAKLTLVLCISLESILVSLSTVVIVFHKDDLKFFVENFMVIKSIIWL